MVKEDGDFKLCKIISRAQSASTTKRKEASCSRCEILQLAIASIGLVLDLSSKETEKIRSKKGLKLTSHLEGSNFIGSLYV